MNNFEINAFSDDEEIFIRKPKVVKPRVNHFEVWE